MFSLPSSGEQGTRTVPPRSSLRPSLLSLPLALGMFELLPPVGLGVQARLNPLLSEPCYSLVSGLLLGALTALRTAPSTVPAVPGPAPAVG